MQRSGVLQISWYMNIFRWGQRSCSTGPFWVAPWGADCDTHAYQYILMFNQVSLWSPHACLDTFHKVVPASQDKKEVNHWSGHLWILMWARGQIWDTFSIFLSPFCVPNLNLSCVYVWAESVLSVWVICGSCPVPSSVTSNTSHLHLHLHLHLYYM